MEEKKDIFDFIEKRSIETPDPSYFMGLADKVMSEIAEEPEEPKAKIIPLYRRPAFWLSGVAAAILVALLLLPEEKNIAPVKEGVDFNDLSKKEVLAYVDENIEDFDEELLMEFIPSNKINVDPYFEPTEEEVIDPIESIVETDSKNLQESLESISDEEILEYLEEEGLGSDDDEDIFI